MMLYVSGCGEMLRARTNFFERIREQATIYSVNAFLKVPTEALIAD